VIPDSLASGYCLSPMKVTTEKGKEFEADCVFKTIGNAKFNSGLITSLVEELGLENSEAMNEKGQIKVKATGVLAFGDITNIYAVGDVSTLDERNQYMTGIAGGECASLNIINAIRGKV
jgi:thioredoxin reductase